jgi:hypothetical protein
MKQSAVPILITFQISAWAAVCMHFYTKSIPKAALAYLVTCGVIVALYKAYITLTSPKSGNDSPTSSNSPVA